MTLIIEGKVGDEIQRWMLTEGSHRVGRGTGSQIVLSDRSVSREHAELVVRAGATEIRDLGSRNGTWVNGEPVSEAVPLAGGDTLRFGSVELAVTDDAATPAAPRAPREISPALLSAVEEIDTSVQLRWDDVHDEKQAVSVHERELLRVLTEAGALLVAPKPLAEVFESVLELVSKMVPSRRIVLMLRENEEAPLEMRASRPAGSGTREKLMLSRTLIDTVIHERTSMLVTDAQKDPRFRDQMSIVAQNVHSAIIAPLFDNERVLGLVYADTNNPFVRYEQDQLRAFTMLANLIAVKITNTRLMERERERERMEQELATAARIQKSLLPSELPSLESYEIYAAQLSCFEVAGDLYDAAVLEDGRLMVVLGDVSGKGMGAALLMSHMMASLRMLYDDATDLDILAERVHKQVLRSSDSRRFVTLFLGRLDPARHRLEYVNAGHNSPILLCENAEMAQLEATGLPIGLVAGVPYRVESVEMPPGCLLCIFSDGIPEAACGDDFYGDDRLLESLRKHRGLPIDEVAAGLLSDLRLYLGDTPPGDDITLFLLRRRL
jgi:serine phosphatase RsbU (regulator of sigma subunit)/pSer/pThr/pTyr-binding forkhead associated (FHA) protein